MTDPTTLTLRDYQEDALARVAAAEARGVRRQLIVAATGLGKTVMFVTLAQRRGGRTLILVHRDELVQQAVAKVHEVWPAATVGVVKGAQNQVRHHVVVASVQTLARPKRLAQFLAPFSEGAGLLGRADPLDLVVVDEAHHATAASYRAVLDGVRAGGDGCPLHGTDHAHDRPATPEEVDAGCELGVAFDPCPGPAGPLLVGVTATPDRGDGRGLHDVFTEIVSNHDMLWGIRAGYLSDLRGLAVKVPKFDAAAMRSSHGDYDQGHAGQMLDDAGAPALIVKAWQEHAAGRRTIVFTPTVAVADHVAEAFRRAGVRADAVNGSTPTDERRAILRSFSDGGLDVVANCAVLTEGYDNPAVDCVIVARPTKSRGLYVQMIGRGTRRHPDKADCLVLDVVGASEDMNLVTVPSLFGVQSKDRRRQMANASALVSDLVLDDREEQVVLGRLAAEEIEMFRKIRSDGIAWVKATDPRFEHVSRYLRSLGKDRHGRVLPTVVLARVDEHNPHRWVAGVQHEDGTKQVLMMDTTMETAQGVAEDYVRKHAAAVALVDANAAWRKRRPSAKQLTAAAAWALPVDPAWTAGDLSERLDEHIAKINAKKARKAKQAGAS